MNYKTRLYAGITAIAVIVLGGIISVITIEKVDNGNVGLKVGLSGKILSKNKFFSSGFHFAGLGILLSILQEWYKRITTKVKRKIVLLQ